MNHPVHKREVFYLPGFDPMPPRRYRELYRKEIARQADISGFEVAEVARGGALSWRVRTRMDGIDVCANINVLYWADIVRASMDMGILATFATLVRTAHRYVASGALRALMKLRKGPVIAALYPVAFLLAQQVLAILVGVLLGLWVFGLAGNGLGVGLGLAVGLGVAWAILRGFRALDHRLYAYYLMQDYGFSSGENGATPAALKPRLADFADQIEAALDGDADEVLLVGHSSGAHLGIEILADILRRRGGGQGPALGFLTLGQVVPMLSFLPGAGGLRRDLAYLSNHDGLTWVDVTAPGDGCSFALCDPVAVSGVAPPDQKWPLVISAAFTQTMAPETWARLRWRFFRLHFQYLCAFDHPGDYDYFRVTAGPLTLRDRYANRGHSRSRIAVPVSPHRSLAQ